MDIEIAKRSIAARASPMSEDQILALVWIERIGSCLSILGCLFICVTFVCSKAFRRPINRLVFYASMGNMMTNVATIISRSAIEFPDSFLCQMQAFLIQMFMAADALWTLAMACNVYLTFYHKFDADKLRSIEKWYFLGCYGVPFVPAFLYIWAHEPDKPRLYGNATLWCWVTSNYDVWRIGTFYGPVWIVIFLTFVIYIRAGREIYNKRKQLRDFSSNNGNDQITILSDPFTSMKTTEIHVTSEAISPADVIDVNRLGRQLSSAEPRPQYSVSVSTDPNPRPVQYKIGNMPTFPTRPKKSSKEANIPKTPRLEREQTSRRYAAIEANRAAWSYTKVAVLFFTAMLVTWIPSSANRVYSVIHNGDVNIPLLFASAFVLPLQGLWNAGIYMSTSWNATRQLFSYNRRDEEERDDPTSFPISMHPMRRITSESDKEFETDSTAELNLVSRPTSREGR